jgi:hypothetical protein
LGLQVQVLSSGQKPKRGRSRVVVGCAGDAEVDFLLDHLNVARHDSHWAYGGLGANLSQAWLVATFRDPLGDGLPVTLLCAQDPKWLAVGLKQLQPGTFPMLRLYRAGFPVLETELNSLGQLRRDRWTDCRPWHMRPQGELEFHRLHYRGWRIDSVGHTPESELEAYVDGIERTWRALAAWSGLEVPESPKLFCQDRAYQWRFSDEPAGWAQVDVIEHAVQALLLPGQRGDGGARAGSAYLEDHLGPASLPWLAEAAGIQASGVYWGVPLAEWWAVLARLGPIPDPKDLVSGEGLERVSPHLVTPLRALLIQTLVDRDAQQLRRLWLEGQQTTDWKPLFVELGARLGALAARPQPTAEALEFADRPPALGVALQGGFDVDSPGMASIAHAGRLQDLQQAHAQAVAYTLCLVNEPLSPLVRTRPMRRSSALGDVRGEPLLLASIAQAKSLSLQVGLGLEVWAKPSGVVLQDLIWPSRAGVETFFGDYGRGALHAALFARLAGVDILCLGEGMGEIARTEAREAELEDSARMDILKLRSESWQRLIESLRPAFPGALTLVLGGHGSVAQSNVWTHLDAVGMEITFGERVMGQLGGGDQDAQKYAWATALQSASRASGDKPFVLWNAGLGAVVREGQGADLPGIGVEAVQDGRALRALARALGSMEERGPVLSFLSPFGLDGSGAGLELGFADACRALEAFAGQK